MEIKRKFNLADVPSDVRLTADTGWVKMDVKWLATKEIGAQFATFGRTIFKPAAGGVTSKHELHTHPNAEEIILVLSGVGRGISGDKEFALGPGDVLFIPKGDLHLVENTSDTEDMEVVFVYGGAASLADAGYNPVSH